MNVSSKDNEVFIEFLSPGAKNPVRLKLVGESKLEGTVDMGGKIGNRRIKFEKVETKSGKIK